MISSKVVRVVKMVAVVLAATTLVWLLEGGGGIVHTPIPIHEDHDVQIDGQHHAANFDSNEIVKIVETEKMKTASVEASTVVTTRPAPISTHGAPVAGEPLSDDGIHVIFSTSCSRFQRWQAELLFFSHMHVGQRGSVTRLVSGCKPPDLAEGETTHRPDFFVDNGAKADVDEMHQSSNPKAVLYEPGTTKAGTNFKFANKPYSVSSWVLHKMKPTDQVVVILDPDMVFLKPITVEKALAASEMLVHDGSGTHDKSFDGANIPRPGRPVGQHYPIGAAWGSDGHFNKKHKGKLDSNYGGKNFAGAVCGTSSPCTNVTDWQGQQSYALGPPYILLHDDAKKLGPSWRDFTPPVVDLTNRDLIADMWSYSMAAAHHDLKHTQIESFMVSNPYGSDEGWPFVMDYINKNPSMSCHAPPRITDAPGPTVLHFCQNLHVKDGRGRTWMYHKGHVPEMILECDLPLLKPPPDDFIATQTSNQDKRLAWNICQLYYHINLMAMAYREKYCVGRPINTSKVIFLHQFSNSCWQKDPKKCFTFATVEPPEYDLPVHKYDAK